MSHLGYAALEPVAEACWEATRKGNEGGTNACVCCLVVSNACKAANKAVPRANMAEFHVQDVQNKGGLA